MGRLITKHELIETFMEHNIKNGYTYDAYRCDLRAVIVYDQSNWKKPYTEEQRSYYVDNGSGKIFFPGLCGNSMYGDCMDGSEYQIRLDWYNWKIERIYLL